MTLAQTRQAISLMSALRAASEGIKETMGKPVSDNNGITDNDRSIAVTALLLAMSMLEDPKHDRYDLGTSVLISNLDKRSIAETAAVLRDNGLTHLSTLVSRSWEEIQAAFGTVNIPLALASFHAAYHNPPTPESRRPKLIPPRGMFRGLLSPARAPL